MHSDPKPHEIRDRPLSPGGTSSGRSCNEQIFTLRNVLEQCREFEKSLAINFIDFKKAFNSVHRESLWKILRLYGIPHKIINRPIFVSMYTKSRCCVRTKDGYCDTFDIITGVRQGCILSPFLFLIVMDVVMRKSMSNPHYGIS